MQQKNHKSKILSSCWVVDIRKWFRRWGVDDLLELSGDVMHYVMIEERLVESLKMLRGQSKNTMWQMSTVNVSLNIRQEYAKSLITTS